MSSTQEKTQEEKEKEALEQGQKIREENIQNKKDIGVGTSRSTTSQQEQQHEQEEDLPPLDIHEQSQMGQKIIQIALTVTLINANKGKYDRGL